ncbi:MAG: hypothetical protein EA369_01150 [Bradymonadales bacterium]|nr:MAG: hypothetical protein EA369_01150 [Bradymonadales bacterium]
MCEVTSPRFKEVGHPLFLAPSGPTGKFFHVVNQAFASNQGARVGSGWVPMPSRATLSRGKSLIPFGLGPFEPLRRCRSLHMSNMRLAAALHRLKLASAQHGNNLPVGPLAFLHLDLYRQSP